MVVCSFFLKGDCRFGDRCRNEHPGAKSVSAFGGGGGGGGGGVSTFGGYGRSAGPTSKEVCQHFLKGNCWYGNSCKFAHTTAGSGQGGFAGQQQFGGQSSFGQSRTTSSVFGGNNKNVSQFNRNQNRFNALSSDNTMGAPQGQQSVFGVGNKQQSSSESILQSQTQLSQIQQIMKRDMETWEVSKQWPLSCYTYIKEEPCIAGLLDFSPEEIRKEAYDAKASNKASAYDQGLKNLLESSKRRKAELKNINMQQLQSEIRSSMSKASQESSMSIQSTNQSASLFGSSMVQPQSLFGSSTTSPVGGGIFGAASSMQQTMSTMGTATSVQMGTLPNQPNAGMFGSTSPANPIAGGLFASAPSAAQNVFGTSNAPLSTNSTVSSSLFGKQPTESSELIGTVGVQQSGMVGQSVFGMPSTSQMNSTQGVTPSNCPLTCSEQDIAAFKADKFVLGQIPECPPPPELCP